MDRISKVGKCIERSSIRIFLEKQNKIAETCDDMISFTIGEPDFQAPPNIVEAAIQALSEGKMKYAPNAGIPELRQAISEDLEKTHGVHYDPDKEIVITPSGMETLRLAAMAILDDDDEMIVNDPCWANHPNHPKMAHGKAVMVPVHEEDNFFYNLDELETYITDKTKAILLNTPNNPTGVVYSEETIQKLAAIMEAKQKEFGIDEFHHVSLHYGGDSAADSSSFEDGSEIDFAGCSNAV